jgi:Domain of unknown function (DUF4349)
MKRLLLGAVLLSLALGCDGANNQGAAHLASKDSLVPQRRKMRWELRPGDPAPSSEKKFSDNKPLPRKIIYTADVDLLVDNFSGAAQKLQELIKQHQGLLAQSEINSDPGRPRFGRWRARIPVERFEDFVNQTAQLGEVLKDKTDSEEITDQYYDYQVRIENKKVQVERLQRIIKEQAGKVSELLEAERELGRVTTELEELKGTVKLWDNQTALATVEVTMLERERYVAASSSFAKTVTNMFWDSSNNLVAVLRSLILLAVALTPWLPVLAVLAFALLVLLRRAKQRVGPLFAGAPGPASQSSQPGQDSPPL